MSLAQPLALLGLLLLPVLALFYMWKARHQRQVVSSTWLWEEALARFSHQPTRRLPLRDPLLLLQMIAVLGLTILLAGPRLSQATHLHRIVVLDDSIAMAATDIAPSRFAQARQRVLAMIAGLGTGDTLSLILDGSRAQVLGEAPGSLDLAALVRHLGPPGGIADVAGAAALARGLAGASGLGTPQVTFLAAAETPALPAGNLPVTTERFGGTLDDQSIGAFSVRCLPTGGGCQAFARVRNSAVAPRQDDLEVWADGKVLGRQSLIVPARGSLDLIFAVPPGARTLRVSLLRPDAVPADDTAWAVVPVPPTLHVLLVSDAPDQLARVLRAIPGLAVQAIATSSYQDTSPIEQDMVVFDGFVPDNPPPNPLLVFNPPPDNVLVNVRATNVFLPVSRIDSGDPLLAGLDLYGMATPGESIDTPSWLHEAVGGPRGPLLLHGVQAGQPVAILPFDLSRSPFVHDLAFPVLMERLVRWLVPLPPASVAPGAAVWLPPGVQSVSDPGGAILSGPLVSASTPGIYRVASSLTGLAVGEPLFAVTTAGPGDTSPQTVRIPPWAAPLVRGTLPLSLWPLMLLAALAALSGEWWFYARRT